MSLMDKIKEMFSGGSDAQDASSDVALDDLAIDEVPPAPVDPVGTPADTPPADPDEQL
jgi:hypothetical protein